MEPTAKHFRKRDAILTCLRQSKAHPSAEWVFSQLKPEIPDLSLGTVYRNLSMFKQQGTIVSLGAVNCVERFDYNTAPHVHFICSECADIAQILNLKITYPNDLRLLKVLLHDFFPGAKPCTEQEKPM